MKIKDLGIEIALTINSLDSVEKQKLLKSIVAFMDKETKLILEDELGVVI